MTNKLEAAMIRDKLQLRRNRVEDCWEVYTTIHGSQLFRWYKISESIKNWYIGNFPEIKSKIARGVDLHSDGTIYDPEHSDFRI